MGDLLNGLIPEARAFVIIGLALILTLPLLWPLFTLIVDAVMLPLMLLGSLIEWVESLDFPTPTPTPTPAAHAGLPTAATPNPGTGAPPVPEPAPPTPAASPPGTPGADPTPRPDGPDADARPRPAAPAGRQNPGPLKAAGPGWTAPGPPPVHGDVANRRAARDFLRKRLARGPLPADALIAEAEPLGISAATLRRAKADLGVRSLRTSEGWLWSLPGPNRGII